MLEERNYCPWCITGGADGKQPILSELIEEPAEEFGCGIQAEVTFKCLRCGYAENRDANDGSYGGTKDT